MVQDGAYRSGERGVALLIVLLVTALLMALIFEFAYGTRVSLRASVNYRDAVRASYIARSGVSFAGKVLAEFLKNGLKQENLEQREWQVVPIVSEGDTELRVRWEDETGKIYIANVRTGQVSIERLERLFGLQGISLEVLDRIKELQDIRMLGDLHRVMSDEEFGKIKPFVTVFSGTNNIDVNTAPPEVLESIGISSSAASMIVEQRKDNPFTDRSALSQSYGISTTVLASLDVTSSVFAVQSHATVGGYTKQAEAVIRRDTGGGYTLLYWRML
jgi:general secretion pathway protein K